MDYIIYYVIGILLLVYLAIVVMNKRNARKRKSRNFMGGYKRKDKGREER